MLSEILRFLFSEYINIYFQNLGNPFLDDIFVIITTISSLSAYFLLASLIFWCFSKKTGIRAMYVIIFSASIAIFAKNIFSMPRPPEYLHKIQETEFGFPSGHAQVSSGFWGYLCGRIKNKWLIISGTAAILSVSLSRIYLGVHYAGDVVGGIIFGLSVSIIFLKTDKLEKLDRVIKYLAAFMLPLILVTIASLQRNLLKEQVEIGLVMAGIGIGYLLEEEHILLSDAENNKQRIYRAVAGIVISGIIYLISSLLFLINSNFIFLRYAALGFATTFISPWAIERMERHSFKNQK